VQSGNKCAECKETKPMRDIIEAINYISDHQDELSDAAKELWRQLTMCSPILSAVVENESASECY